MNLQCLASLDQKELVRLADILVSEQSVPPLTELSLQNYLTRENASQVAQLFQDLQKKNISTSQLAIILRAFVAGTQSAKDTPPPVEVVVTGPDTTTRNRDTAVVVRQLFGKAQHQVLVVGYAIHQGKSVFQKLGQRLDSDESIRATLCLNIERGHGNTSLSQGIIERSAIEFEQNIWPGKRLPKVYYDPRSLDISESTVTSMHAKCVVIDGKEALVTSANFTEAAQVRNIELGLLVKSSAIATQIEEHFQGMIQNEILSRLPLSGMEQSS